MTGPMQALCGSILILATAGFATFASGDLLVANKSADSMTRIDVASGQTIGSFATDPGPHEIEVDPAGQRAAISNYGSEDEPGETLTLVDLRTSSVTTIDLAPRARPHGIAWMPDGRRLVVTTEGSNTLSVVDLVERRVVDAIETGGEQPHMVVVDRSGRFAWVTQIASGSVSRIDLESGSVVVHRTTGEGTEGLALSGDEEQLWVTNRGDGSVSVRDPETLEELGRLEGGGPTAQHLRGG